MSENKITTPEGEYDYAPLYDGLPMDDYREPERPFTVTVAGSERHDGEAPYTYVVNDRSMSLAWGQALAWHIQNQEDIDSYVVARLSHEGMPPEDDEYGWNDLRPEREREAQLEALVKDARTKLDAFNRAVAEYTDEHGDTKPEFEDDWDRRKGEAELGAWDVFEALATFAPEK